MALIKCPECGAEISDKAIQCPQCGIVLHQQTTEYPTPEVPLDQNEGVSMDSTISKAPDKKAYSRIIVCICSIIAIAILALCGLDNYKINRRNQIKQNIENSQRYQTIVENAAQSVVGKILESPSTAIYGTLEILDNDAAGRFLVYVPVMSASRYGTSTREYLVVVQVASEDAKTFSYTDNARHDITHLYSLVMDYKAGVHNESIGLFLSENRWNSLF
ncbi:MAG: zinc ribbon domain-containing protein [Oscillospiraceae bacterium]|nr:zinc ribbon domain-containing protein [Oscillospiraceae bacterium]